MGCVPSSVLADQGASPVFHEQFMVSSRIFNDIGTATRGEASRLNRGPLKMAPAPNCTGFSLGLQSSQMERATILDDYGSNCEQTAPHLWGFIEAFVHDKPYVSEMAHKLMYFWVLAYRSVTLKNTLVRCKRFCVTYDESTLLIFYDKVMKNAGALPSVLKKNADSKGYTLYDLLVDCSRSRSPVIPIGGTPAPTPSVAPLSTVSGSMAPTCDDLGIQPAPPAERNVHDDCGAPPTEGHGDPRPGSDHGQISDGPVWPPHVHLLGPSPDDTDDPVQLISFCELPATPPDDCTDGELLSSDDDDSSSMCTYSDMPLLEDIALTTEVDIVLPDEQSLTYLEQIQWPLPFKDFSFQLTMQADADVKAAFLAPQCATLSAPDKRNADKCLGNPEVEHGDNDASTLWPPPDDQQPWPGDYHFDNQQYWQQGACVYDTYAANNHHLALAGAFISPFDIPYFVDSSLLFHFTGYYFDAYYGCYFPWPFPRTPDPQEPDDAHSMISHNWHSDFLGLHNSKL